MSRDDQIPSASGPSEAKILAPVPEEESARQGTHLGKEVHPAGGRGWHGFGGGATRFRLRERRWFHPEKSEAGPDSAFPFTDAKTRQQSVLVHLEHGKFRRRRPDRCRCLLPRWRSGSKARRSYRYRTLDFRWEALFRCRRAVIDGPDEADTEVLGVDLWTATRRGGDRTPETRFSGAQTAHSAKT